MNIICLILEVGTFKLVSDGGEVVVELEGSLVRWEMGLVERNDVAFIIEIDALEGGGLKSLG